MAYVYSPDCKVAGGVGLQIVRDWVLRFNARGPDGLLDGKSPGQPSKLNDLHCQAIASMVETGPIALSIRKKCSANAFTRRRLSMQIN